MPVFDTIRRALGRAPRQATLKDATRVLQMIPDVDDLASRDGRSGRKSVDFIESLNAVPIHKFSDYNSYLTAAASKVWAAWKAVDIVAAVLVSARFKIIQPNGKTRPEVENLSRLSPDLYRMLKWPNPFYSWEAMMYLWTFHMKFTGNAYWLKDQIDGRGRATCLYPLFPQFMSPIPDARRYVSGYEYRINGKRILYTPDEIIHFRRPHPGRPIVGLGDVEPSEPLYNDFINRDVYREQFITNGAQPSGVLVREQEEEDQTQWEKVKKWWDASYGGKKNIGKTAFLNGKWSYHQLGMTSQAMQDLEKNQATIEHIFLNHGVPLSIVGVKEAANYATARQDDVNFRTLTCKPLIDIFVGMMNGCPTTPGFEDVSSGLVSAFNPNWLLDYDLAGTINIEQVAKDYKELVYAGAMTPNEYREACGMARVDNPLLDQYYILNTLTPLEVSGLTAPNANDLANLTDPARQNPNNPAAPKPGTVAPSPAVPPAPAATHTAAAA